LRTMNAVLPLVSPFVFSTLMDVLSVEMDEQQKAALHSSSDAGFTEYLFRRLGESLIADQKAAASATSAPLNNTHNKKQAFNAVDSRTGEVTCSMSGDFVSLLRTLSMATDTHTPQQPSSFDLTDAKAVPPPNSSSPS